MINFYLSWTQLPQFLKSHILHANTVNKEENEKYFLTKIDAKYQLTDEPKSLLFKNLTKRLFVEYSNLTELINNPAAHCSEICWRSRNVLELCVWLNYCFRINGGAKRFQEDAMRDSLNLIKALETWGQGSGQTHDWLDNAREGMERIGVAAQEAGLEEIDDKFLKITDAAAACGLKDIFSVCNKFFSKFAHPTALLITSENNLKSTVGNLAFSLAAVCFLGGIEALNYGTSLFDKK